MGISEITPTLGQGIHMRSDRLRMTTKEADPIVQVINRDEENIWLGAFYLGPETHANQEGK